MNEMKFKSDFMLGNWFIIKKLLRISPSYFITLLMFNAYDGIMIFLNSIFILRKIINSVQSHTEFLEVSNTLLTFTLINIVYITIKVLFNHQVLPKWKLKIENYFSKSILDSFTSINMEYFDDASYFDDFIAGTKDISQRAISVMNCYGNLVKSISTFMSVITLVILVDSICLILVAISLIIAGISSKKIAKLRHNRLSEITTNRRKSEYIKEIFYRKEYIKEIKMYQYSDKLIDNHDTYLKEISDVFKSYSPKIFILSICEDISTIMFDIVYVSYLVIRAIITSNLLIGDFIAMLNSAWSLSNNIEAILKNITELNEHCIYIMKYKHFIEKSKSVITGDKIPGLYTGDISFRDVKFKYNIDSSNVLKNISFNIKKNEKVAIVGYNGAGKSTLLKVLLRLYDIDEGSICEDNINIKSYDPDSYRDKFSIVFQDFNTYAVSLSENVKMDLIKESDYPSIIESLKKVNFMEKQVLERDVLTKQISREFDDGGLILSGGEDQKVAISRVLLNSKNYVIFDEPTAALDPESEYHFNQLVKELFKDKTVIVVSHRLSTVRMMDKIIVLNNGKVEEIGSHKELLVAGGKYSDMYKAQAKNYGITV